MNDGAIVRVRWLTLRIALMVRHDLAVDRAVERYVRLGFSEIILMANANRGDQTLALAEALANDVLPRVRSARASGFGPVASP